MHRQPTRIERLLALLLCVSLLNINPTLTIGVKGVATDPAFAPSAAVAQAEPTVTATPTAVPTSTPAALALAAFPAFPQSAQAASNALVG